MTYLLAFLAGALICNAIPHLASGLQGEPFPSPFAKPLGRGVSRPAVNVAWGSANLAAGLLLGDRAGPALHSPLGFGLAAAGFLILGLILSRHFGAPRS